MKSDKVVFGYARNYDLVETLEKAANERRFSVYFASFKQQFDKIVVKQRWRSTAAKILSSIFNFNDPSHIISQKVLACMGDGDLKLLCALRE